MKTPRYIVERAGKKYLISSYGKLKKLVLIGDIAPTELIFDFDTKQWVKALNIGSIYHATKIFGKGDLREKKVDTSRSLPLPEIKDGEDIPAINEDLGRDEQSDLDKYMQSIRMELCKKGNMKWSPFKKQKKNENRKNTPEKIDILSAILQHDLCIWVLSALIFFIALFLAYGFLH